MAVTGSAPGRAPSDAERAQGDGSSGRAGGDRPHAAWIRLSDEGVVRIDSDEAAAQAGRYGAAVLDPWETAAAERMKRADPGMLLLCRKSIAVVDRSQPGPLHSTGVSYDQAVRSSGWFALDRSGERITWAQHPGQWQMRVWDPEYRRAWSETVARELDGSPFDGVLAVEDADESHALDRPFPDLGSRSQQRDAHDALVAEAGEALRQVDRILVAEISDARHAPARWTDLSQWGGVYEPNWMCTASERMLDSGSARQQAQRISHDPVNGLPEGREALVRMPVTPRLLGQEQVDEPGAQRLVRYGLAAFWVFGGGRGLFTAGSPDGSRSHWVPEMQWNLGEPLGPPESVANMWSRGFAGGWVVVNLASDGRRRRHVRIPGDLLTHDGHSPPEQVVLGAHQGLILRRA